ncbi:cell division protein DivIC [Aequitasia blattaphilus]|uniref:Septum formation initiator family protein n=1 Tax=Aequitasia blattaphilus TaxID=2949332 RepID=A0ABT1E9R9_9FIRM|nr:septum formation initiator family protein [Aequitasia blattaphilus]MCP1102570.1 septum formation initiator family protein [Aequitasia blattaphilus]MCR8615210.1 septum formation initiator family protein [Aequitasia blattaphilus]
MGSIKKKQEKRRIRNRRRVNRGSMVLVSGVLLLLTVVMSVSGYNMKVKADANTATKVELEAQIEEEKKRSAEIEELGEYVGTDAYVEDVAREKLGLIYENEIIFKTK